MEKTASTHPNGWPSHKSHYGFWTKDVCLAEDQFHRHSIHFHKRLICGLTEKGILKTKTKNANSCGKPSLAWIWAEKVKLRPLYRGITRSWGLAGSWDHGIRWGGHSIDWFTSNQFLKNSTCMMSVTVTVTVDKRLTCVDRDTVSVGEHINQKVSFSFGHYPELPPPPDPD